MEHSCLEHLKIIWCFKNICGSPSSLNEFHTRQCGQPSSHLGCIHLSLGKCNKKTQQKTRQQRLGDGFLWKCLEKQTISPEVFRRLEVPAWVASKLPPYSWRLAHGWRWPLDRNVPSSERDGQRPQAVPLHGDPTSLWHPSRPPGWHPQRHKAGRTTIGKGALLDVSHEKQFRSAHFFLNSEKNYPGNTFLNITSLSLTTFNERIQWA